MTNIDDIFNNAPAIKKPKAEYIGIPKVSSPINRGIVVQIQVGERTPSNVNPNIDTTGFKFFVRLFSFLYGIYVCTIDISNTITVRSISICKKSLIIIENNWANLDDGSLLNTSYIK